MPQSQPSTGSASTPVGIKRSSKSRIRRSMPGTSSSLLGVPNDPLVATPPSSMRKRPSVYNLTHYNERFDSHSHSFDRELINTAHSDHSHSQPHTDDDDTDPMDWDYLLENMPAPPPITDTNHVVEEKRTSSPLRRGTRLRRKRSTPHKHTEDHSSAHTESRKLLHSPHEHSDEPLSKHSSAHHSTSSAPRPAPSHSGYGTINYPRITPLQEKPFPSQSTKPSSISRWERYVKDYVLPKPLNDPNDALQMGPLQKFIKYRKFPWKLIIDLIICMLLFTFVTFVSLNRKKFIQANARGFVLTFLPEGLEEMKDSIEGFNSFYFLTVHDMQEHIKSVVHTYENFNASSVGTYLTRKHIWMETTVWDDDTSLRKILVPQYEPFNKTTGQLNPQPKIAGTDRGTDYPYILSGKRVIRENLTVEHPYGIFERSGIEERHLFDQLLESKILLSFQSLDINKGTVKKPQCYNWTLTLNYDFSVRSSRLPCKATYEYKGCEDVKYSVYEAKFNAPASYIAIAVCVFSIISLLLNVKAVVYRLRFFVRQKKKKDRTTISWSKFLWAYFSFWFPLVIVKDVLNILGTVMFVFSTRGGIPFEVMVTIILGFGCLTTFVSVIRYLQYIPKFYVLIMTIRIAFPFGMRYLIGVMPLFLGYTFASVVWFGHYVPYFSTIDIAAVTNFCCLHGDVIRDTFDMLYGWSPLTRFWGRIYLYSFILLFITVVLTMFLLIIEDAYFGLWAQKAGENSLLTSSQAKPSIAVKNEDLKESFLSPHYFEESGGDKSLDEESIQDMDAVIEYYTNESSGAGGNKQPVGEVSAQMQAGNTGASKGSHNSLEHVYARALIETIQRKVRRRQGSIQEGQSDLLKEIFYYAREAIPAVEEGL